MSFLHDGVRMVNRRSHDCGCITAFDVVAWASRIAHPCEEHGAAPVREDTP